MDGIGDVVFDSSGADTVSAAISFALGSDFEALLLSGAADTNGMGGATALRLTMLTSAPALAATDFILI